MCAPYVKPVFADALVSIRERRCRKSLSVGKSPVPAITHDNAIATMPMHVSSIDLFTRGSPPSWPTFFFHSRNLNA